LPVQVHLQGGVGRKQAGFGQRQHAARAASRVGHFDHAVGFEQLAIFGANQQIHHQVNNLARRKVFAGVLVQRLVKAADQFLEDGAHRVVVHLVGVQINIFEALDHQKEQPGLIQLGDGVAQVKLFNHLTHIIAEAVDIGLQIGRQVGGVIGQALKGKGRGIVENKARSLAQHGVKIGQFTLVSGMGLQHSGLGRLQHAVNAAQHRERQDDILILAAAKSIADQVGD